jgi:adenosylmethionine-8-amino-7-oxononanoate aminotransferase
MAPLFANEDYEELNPIVIEKGEGVWLYDIDGNRYLDCISSWWTNTLGHSNKRINEAIKIRLTALNTLYLQISPINLLYIWRKNL